MGRARKLFRALALVEGDEGAAGDHVRGERAELLFALPSHHCTARGWHRSATSATQRSRRAWLVGGMRGLPGMRVARPRRHASPAPAALRGTGSARGARRALSGALRLPRIPHQRRSRHGLGREDRHPRSSAALPAGAPWAVGEEFDSGPGALGRAVRAPPISPPNRGRPSRPRGDDHLGGGSGCPSPGAATAAPSASTPQSLAQDIRQPQGRARAHPAMPGLCGRARAGARAQAAHFLGVERPGRRHRAGARGPPRRELVHRPRAIRRRTPRRSARCSTTCSRSPAARAWTPARTMAEPPGRPTGRGGSPAPGARRPACRRRAGCCSRSRPRAAARAGAAPGWRSRAD